MPCFFSYLDKFLLSSIFANQFFLNYKISRNFNFRASRNSQLQSSSSKVISWFPYNQEEREIVIEGYSSRMVQLAKRALQTSLALPPPGAGAPPPALQQAAIASTSDCEARGAAVAARRNSQLLLSSAAAPPPQLRDEEAVSSTTECEAVAAASTPSDTGNVQQGNVFCSVGGSVTFWCGSGSGSVPLTN
jgi:hypothetical protein